MKNSKILHINSVYLTSKLHERLVEKLDSKEFNNTIYMPMKKETIKNIKYKSSFNVLNPVVFKNHHKLFYFYKQNLIYNNFMKNIDPTAFDIIHAHSLFTDGNLAYKLNKAFNIPYVVTVRGYTDIFNFFKKRPDLRYRGYEILKNASKVFFVSKAHKLYFLDKYLHGKTFQESIESKIEILPNGIDDKWFIHQSKTPKSLVNKHTINLVTVGEIIPRKNQLLSIETVKFLNEHSKYHFKLSIVGKVVDDKYYKKLINASDENITFSSHLSIGEMLELYEKNDIFILPSKYETFGLVYPEAMSQGLPVIYSINQGLHYFFDEGFIGYAVQNNKEDMAKKILKITENYDQMSKNCLTAFQVFNWKQISLKLTRVYNDIIGGLDG